MLTCILIDDEKPALRHLEMHLAEDGRFRVQGMFTTAQAGLDYLAETSVDAVFLDMEMPGMNGLRAAERIRHLHGDKPIIFVTAYSEYAIEAFQVRALDYILKPIDPERLGRTIDYAEDRCLLTAAKELAQSRVRCFGPLSFEDEAGREWQPQWKTAKSLELFVHLLHQRQRWVGKELLLETLWPDIPTEKSLTYLHTAISHIRKLMKDWGDRMTVEYALNGYRLTRHDTSFDAEQFDLTTDDLREVTSDDYGRLDQAFALYRGDYLADMDYPWAASHRGYLLDRFVKLTVRLAEYETGSGRARKAVERLRLAQERTPYSEEICRLLLISYARMQDYEGVRAAFDAFGRLLQEDLGIAPDEDTASLYRRLVESARNASKPAGGLANDAVAD